MYVSNALDMERRTRRGGNGDKEAEHQKEVSFLKGSKIR